MTDPPHLDPILVARPDALEALARALEGEPVIALDTESNSFHVYRERVCLLQISTRTRDWIVDPLAVDPRPLGPLLQRIPVLVLHGADYDVRCLKREYGFGVPGLFDTMAAARRVGVKELGLPALVARHLGVRLSKSSQRSDWGRRPLTREQVSYAALDTHYLLPLHDWLAAALAERNAADAAREEFARIAAVEPRPKVFDPTAWRRLKGARDLDPEGMSVLAALWVAREARASEIDRPPFKVMPELAMIEIARRRPRQEVELLQVPGVTPMVLRRMGDAITAALRAQG